MQPLFESDDNQDYDQLKADFMLEVTEFLNTQASFDTFQIVEKLNVLVVTYEKYYCDNDEDKELIRNLKKDLTFYQQIIKDKEILGTKVKDTEKKEISRTATLLQYEYKTSLWRKLFNQNSFNNDLYGQVLFHVTLGAIADLKIELRADKILWARPSLFYMQRSRTGKNEGINFQKKVLSHIKIKTLDTRNDIILETKPVQVLVAGKQNDPTWLDRFKVELKKGVPEVKKDKYGEPMIIPGALTKSRLVIYPEASSLLNPKSKDNQEATEIHLNLLESEGTYVKELERWGGHATETKGGMYALVALTRPLENIKHHIVYSGLLQRTIFIPRPLSRAERVDMLAAAARYSHLTKKERETYEKDFAALLHELKSYQDFVLRYPPTISDEDSTKISAAIHEKFLYFMDDIEKETSTEYNKQMYEDFVANYRNFMLMLAFQSAAIRRDKHVGLGDIEYAFNILKKSYDLMKVWIEENLAMDKISNEKLAREITVIKNLLTTYPKGCEVKEAIAFIQDQLKVSHPTATRVLKTHSGNEKYPLIVDWKSRTVRHR